MIAMDKIALIEPSWGMNILQWWIDIQSKYDWISSLASIFADAFVIIYPIFLVCVYVYAMIKKKPKIKQWCLYIFFATLIAVLINIWIQTFFYKERPIVVLNHVEAEETLLHDILPISSFPSDHAVVSMSFAIAVLLWWVYSKRKIFTWFGVLFVLVSLIMTGCRILTLVHRPSDIVAWLWLWILVSCILMLRPFRYLIIRLFINPLIRLEQWIMRKVFHYDQWKI